MFLLQIEMQKWQITRHLTGTEQLIGLQIMRLSLIVPLTQRTVQFKYISKQLVG